MGRPGTPTSPAGSPLVGEVVGMTEFRLPETTAELALSGSEFDGAEVVVRLSVPVATWEVILRLATTEGSTLEEVREMQQLFADEGLVSWNLADHKGPLPADIEGIRRLPPNVLGTIFGEWAGAIVHVPRPLGQPSRSGGTSKRRASRSRPS